MYVLIWWVDLTLFYVRKLSRTPGKTPAAPEQATRWNALTTWLKDPWAGDTVAEKALHLRVCAAEWIKCTQYCLCAVTLLSFLFVLGLISRALPREGMHGDSKDRPVIGGSIMLGKALTFLIHSFIHSFFLFIQLRKNLILKTLQGRLELPQRRMKMQWNMGSR